MITSGKSIVRILRSSLRSRLFVRFMSSGEGCQSNSDDEAAKMQGMYDNARKVFESKKLPRNINMHDVFTCNELDLGAIDVYGFDYDYTLACYRPNLHDLIYDLGRQILVETYKYPKEILQLDFEKGFAIRGLHYDIQKGLLMKIDSYLQIQLDTVYRGRTQVSEDEVLKLYDNRVLSAIYFNDQARNRLQPDMIQLADLFSVPGMCLLSNVTEFFVQNNIPYHPEILFDDIMSAIKACHPLMHEAVTQNVETYLGKNEKLVRFFRRLMDANKKLFLMTNSSFRFVNAGLNYLLGPNWRDFFDVIIMQARKPYFFTDKSRPLRLFDETTNSHVWSRVTKLEKGQIYYEGTLKRLQELTGWDGRSVLYFGDHPYNDLADVSLHHGWRTGAIISELSHEIETLNTETFKRNINWLQLLTKLIESSRKLEGETAERYIEKWIKEREEVLQATKTIFNKQFGSVFRTFHSPTYFSKRLFRFADIYTSDITNLLDYSVNHTFYARRGVLPHEYTTYFL